MSEDENADGGAAGGGIETVLADARFQGLAGLLPKGALSQLAGALVRKPGVPARHLKRFAADLKRIVVSGEQVAELDFRFADRAWRENPVLNRIALGYAAAVREVQAALDETDLDNRTRRQLQIPLDNVVAALAPTNSPLTNPAVWKEVIDTGGASLAHGVKNLVHDLGTVTKLPTSVDRERFVLGETIAATPGKVVRRERLYELLEFEPVTETIDVVPTIIVASPVNKHYLIDLAPDNSVLKGLLAQGRRGFVLSWVNPDETHADAGFDAYVGSILEAIETVTAICDTDRVHLLGLCGGGQLALLTAGYLAATDRQEMLASLTVAIAIADFHGDDEEALIGRKAAEAAIRKASARGYFKATDQSYSFALMRPDECIWIHVVNHYLLGRPAPAVPLIAWAVDQTNLAARFGADMIRTALDNGLAMSGGVVVLGEPIDTREITVDTFVLGASLDHISPWKDCFRTVGMLGGDTTFVLADGGHAISIARPPGHAKSFHWAAPVEGTDPDEWLAGAERTRGSWWNAWSTWIEKLTPETQPAPTRLGSDAFPPLDDAPGQYVRRVLT